MDAVRERRESVEGRPGQRQEASDQQEILLKVVYDNPLSTPAIEDAF